MALGDDAIIPCMTLLTDSADDEIASTQKKMNDGENPMIYKKQLAFELTKQFNSESDAKKAQQEFETRFQKGNVAEANLPSFSAKSLDGSIIDVLVSIGISTSRSEAKRLVEQKAVKVNATVVTSVKDQAAIKAGDIIEIGRKAVKIT